jgi:hypothetical protein
MRIAFGKHFTIITSVWLLLACSKEKEDKTHCTVERHSEVTIVRCPDGSVEQLVSGVDKRWSYAASGDLNGINNVPGCEFSFSCALASAQLTKNLDGTGLLWAQVYYAGGYLSSCTFKLKADSADQQNFCRAANNVLLRFTVNISDPAPTLKAVGGPVSGITATDAEFSLNEQ